MAALIRSNHIQLVRKLLSNSNKNTSLCLISTSPKNRETVSTALGQASAPAKSQNESKTVNKNWVSYGFDFRDKANDRSAMKGSYFFSVTLCIVWGTFIWSYLPDPQLRDWAQREGYLQLRQREAAGQELISPNYVDPSLINLPSDEELGDTEIII